MQLKADTSSQLNYKMMIRISFLYIKIIILVLIFPCAANLAGSYSTSPIDSLETKYILVADSLKLSMLNTIAEEYLGTNPMKAMEKAKNALKIAEASKNFQEQARALQTLGQAQRYLLSDFDKALEHSFEALKIEEQYKLEFLKATTLSSIAEIYKEIGNNNKSLGFYMQALVVYQKLKDSRGMIQTYNAIGISYLLLNSPQKALNYHEKALSLSKRLNSKQLEGSTIFYIAEVLKSEEKYKEAIDYQSKALAIRKTLNDEAGLGASYTSLGEIYSRAGNMEKALSHHVAGIRLKRKLNDKKGLAKSYNEVGTIFIKTEDYNRAIKNLELALQYGVEENAKKQIRESYELLYTCHAAQENYSQALEYKELFSAISEFIYSEESDRKIAEMETRFEIQKKEDEIGLLQKDKEVRDLKIAKQNDLKNSLIVGLVLLAIIATLIYYSYQTKRKSNIDLTATNIQIKEKNLALEELNATKDKFFSIISHDLKGPLNSLTSFSSLLINHTAHLSKEEIQMLAVDLDKSVKGLFGLLENLLEWSRSQSGNIKLNPEVLDIQDLINQCKQVLSKTAENKNIRLITPDYLNFSIMADRNSVSTIIRNLISNALKFTPQGGEVKVEAVESSNMVLVSVSDTGVGMSEDVMDKLFRIDKKHSTKGTANEKGTGLGLILCKEFVEKNGGTISVESKEGQGSIFSFTLPKAQYTNFEARKAS